MATKMTASDPQSDGDAQRARRDGRRGLARPPRGLARDTGGRPLDVRAAGRGANGAIQRTAAARRWRAGSYPVAAKIVAGGETFTRGLHRRISAHHGASTFCRRTARIKALDVACQPVCGSATSWASAIEVPAAIEQLGATVTLLDAGDLAPGRPVTVRRDRDRRARLRARARICAPTTIGCSSTPRTAAPSSSSTTSSSSTRRSTVPIRRR